MRKAPPAAITAYSFLEIKPDNSGQGHIEDTGFDINSKVSWYGDLDGWMKRQQTLE